jgi:metal-responsive CopG/Arc/MetJ family transcriptional regulator
MHMRRTSILLDPGLLAELERLARRDGRPTAHVIREALESYVAQQVPEERVLPAFVGLGHPAGLAHDLVEPSSPDEPSEG